MFPPCGFRLSRPLRGVTTSVNGQGKVAGVLHAAQAPGITNLLQNDNKNTQAMDVRKAQVTYLHLLSKSGLTEWSWNDPSPHNWSFFSSCFWIGIVGLFCGEALVEWAIILVGESDDDFWQNAAAAPCQTIWAIAISSHGHARARRAAPQTSCFSLRSQTGERLNERSGRWWRGRRRVRGLSRLQMKGFGNRSGRDLTESRVSTSAKLRAKETPAHPTLTARS